MHSLEGQAELVWTAKTGRPPREIDDYHPLEVLALLTHMDDARAEGNRLGAERTPWWDKDPPEEQPAAQPGHRGRVKGPPTGRRWRYDEPRYTGDPVADAWEAAIARGEVPDLER